MKTKEAIVLAGGMGTRLKGVVDNIPKPMAPICDKPFLIYLLQYLKKEGISKVIFSVGYKYEIIKNFFGNSWNGITINYAVEKEPLGTGGAIRLALSMVESERVFVLNGDTFFDVSLSKMEKESADTVIAIKPMRDFDRYGTVLLQNNKIIAFQEKKRMKEGLINGGIYLLNKNTLNHFYLELNFSFEKEFLEKELGRLFAFVSDTYFIDIGIPEDYEKAQQYFCNNR